MIIEFNSKSLGDLLIREIDKKIAKEWFGKACNGGYQMACILYKDLFKKGY